MSDPKRGRPLPRGNAIEIGDFTVGDGPDRRVVERGILIVFDTEEAIREAVRQRALAFELFSEDVEEVR